MLIDKELEFSSAQLLTASAKSTNHLDTQAAGRAINELWLVALIPVVLDSAAEAATLTIALRTAAALDVSSLLDTPTTLYATAAIAEATLVAGYVAVKMRLPEGLLRYIDLYYTVGTEDFTSGSIDAFLTMNPELWY